MNRGNIKKILFPYIIKHIVHSLCGAAIFFIFYLLFQLISTLTIELSQSNEDPTKHRITTSKAMYYLGEFIMLILFALTQTFGMFGLLKQNRNILVTFISSLLISFVIIWIDYLANRGNLFLALFFLIQAFFTYLFLSNVMKNKYRSQNVSNIHYIPMPEEDSVSRGSFPYRQP